MILVPAFFKELLMSCPWLHKLNSCNQGTYQYCVACSLSLGELNDLINKARRHNNYALSLDLIRIVSEGAEGALAHLFGDKVALIPLITAQRFPFCAGTINPNEPFFEFYIYFLPITVHE